jgi:hypothetical protein
VRRLFFPNIEFEVDQEKCIPAASVLKMFCEPFGGKRAAAFLTRKIDWLLHLHALCP